MSIFFIKVEDDRVYLLIKLSIYFNFYIFTNIFEYL